MNIFIETAHAMAQAPANGTAPAGGGLLGLLPMFAILAVAYFLILRPYKKQQQQVEDMRKNIKKGDAVVTSGGLQGTVKNVGEDSIQVEIAQGVVVNVVKASVFAKVDEPKGKK